MKKIISGALALLLITGAAQAQDVKKEKQSRQHGKEQLNLTDEQKAKMKTLHEAQRKEMMELQKNDQITVAEQRKRREGIRQQYEKQYRSILTPEQQKLAAEFRHGQPKDGKNNGMHKGRSSRKDRAAALNLSTAQQEKMRQLQQDFRGKHQALRSNSALSDDQKKEQGKALAQQHRKEVQAILTPEQQAQMKSFRKDQRSKTGK